MINGECNTTYWYSPLVLFATYRKKTFSPGANSLEFSKSQATESCSESRRGLICVTSAAVRASLRAKSIQADKCAARRRMKGAGTSHMCWVLVNRDYDQTFWHRHFLISQPGLLRAPRGWSQRVITKLSVHRMQMLRKRDCLKSVLCPISETIWLKELFRSLT